MEYPEWQRHNDEEQLRLLTIFHYVYGGLTACFSSIFLVHFFIGLAATLNPGALSSGGGPTDPGMGPLGAIFMFVGGGAVLLGWTLAALTALAGKRITQRTGHTFIFVMAILNCLSMPFGTALGVFTIVVISRPSVKALFHPASF